MQSISTCIAVLTLSCAAAAQLVSPQECLNNEGNSNNTFPFFSSAFHYQQVNGDLPTTAVGPIKGLSFRRDGTSSTSSVARSYSASISMGVVDFASITTTFASNYDTAGATVVLPATTVNLPAMPAKPTTPPAAFTASIPFATPYIYTAQKALVWEWVMTSSSTTASYVMDAHSGAATLTGAQTALGTGCTATGQTSPMTADASLTTTATNISYTASTTFGRANSAGATLIGTNNPNAAFPICNGTLYTNALVTVPALSDANGAFTTGALAFSYSPALNGMKVYTQTYTADAAQGPIPAAVSNGVESIIPALPQQYARIYASGNATATTGSLGLAYSVVTRFD